MATLTDSLNQTVTPEVIGKIGTKLGVDNATAQQAAEIGVPLITGSIAKASSTPAGASRIFDMLGKMDPNMINDVLGGISGSGASPGAMPGASGNMLDNLFGGALGPITNQIKQSTGIDVGPFLPMLAPLVAGALAKFTKSNNLDAAGLANVLQTETKAFASSGSPIAGLVSGALNMIGSPVAATGQATGQVAGTGAGVAGATAATAGMMSQQAGQTASSAATAVSSTSSSAANTVTSTANDMSRDVTSTMTSGGRPTGITILGVLAIIGGVLSLCGGAGLMGLGGLGLGLGATTVGVDQGAAVGFGAITGLLGLGSVASGLLLLIGGIGLLGLKNWGRILLLIGVIIGLISAVLQLIGALTGGGDFLGGLIGLVINGVILWYLQRPDVKAAFGK